MNHLNKSICSLCNKNVQNGEESDVIWIARLNDDKQTFDYGFHMYKFKYPLLVDGDILCGNMYQ